MHRFTLQSFCKIGFSKDLRLLDDFQEATVSSGGRGCQLTFSDAFDRLQNITDTRIFNPIWPVTEWLSGTAAEVGEYKRIMQKFSADIIRERRDDGVDNNDDCNDLLSYYLAAKADDSGRSFNDSELHDVVMNMIMYARIFNYYI
jgi:cytochrome P450